MHALTDAERLRLTQLLRGELPADEVERLASVYADDARLAELAESVSHDDTLLNLLKDQDTVVEPDTDELLRRILARLQPTLPHALTEDTTYATRPTSDDTSPPDSLPPASVTEVLPDLDYYRPIRILGQGGMGTVYLAVDTRLGREVAVKTLRRDLAAVPQAKDRFFREARAAAKLDHDHIVPIYYVGESSGTPFLAMPHLKGETLDSLLRRTAGPLPVDAAVRIARETALGLAAAHAAGLIHRDIKPGNIWLEAPRGRIKILDFGLAKVASPGPDLPVESLMTGDGVLVGTPAYMSPEQARGGKIDPRTDLFSLGCVLYYMLTGQRPFAGSDVLTTLANLATHTPPPAHTLNPLCPPALSQLVQQLLEKSPDSRPATAQEVIESLEQLPLTPAPAASVGDAARVTKPPTRPAPQPTHTAPQPPTATNPKSKIQNPKFAAAALTAAAALLLLLAAGIIIKIRTKDGTTTEIQVPAGATVTIENPPQTPTPDPAHPSPANPAPPTTPEAAHGEPVSLLKSPWKMGAEETALPGIVPRPAEFPGFGRWQANTNRPNLYNVRDCALSPNKKLLAIADGRAQIRVYDVDTWKLQRWFPGHKAPIVAIGWSPDGEWLASGAEGEDDSLRFWNVDGTAGPVHDFGCPIESLNWHPKENLLLVGGTAEVALCRPDAAPQRFGRFRGHKVRWLPDGENFAVSLIPEVQLWNRNGTRGPTLKHDNSVYDLACSSTGTITTLSYTNEQRLVRFWTLDGRAGPTLNVRDEAHRLFWNPAGTELTVTLVNTTRMTVVDAHAQPLYGGEVDSGAVDFVFYLDRDLLSVCNGWARRGRLVTSLTEPTLLQTRSELLFISGGLAGLSWNPEGTQFATSGEIRLWDQHGTSCGPALTESQMQVRWSPHGDRLASEYADVVVSLFSSSGKLLAKLPQLESTMDRFRSLAWSPDGSRIAVSTNKEVTQWNLDASPGPALQQQDDRTRLRPVTWGPQGEIVSTGVEPWRVQFWGPDGRPGRSIELSSECDSLAFSPDKAWLAVASKDRLEFREAESGELKATYAIDSKIHMISWSPNSQQVALTTNRMGEMAVIDVKGQLVRRVLVPHSLFSEAFWSRQNQIAAAVGGGVRVWNGSTGKVEWTGQQFLTSQGNLGHVAFSGAGEVLSSSGAFEEEVIYLHEQPDGRIDILTPTQFRTRLAAWDAKARAAPSEPSGTSPGWQGWPADAPRPAIAPFSAEQARQHQAAWAKYLGVSVEYENSIGMRFQLVPPGEYFRGSTAEEISEVLKGSTNNAAYQEFVRTEAPRHKVVLTRPLYVGRHEVTQRDYEKVLKKNPSTFSPAGQRLTDPGARNRAAKVAGMDTTLHPVETVSWQDAAEFCIQLSELEKRQPIYRRNGQTVAQLESGDGYRLPTEAEWEFACRAGTTTRYWLGDEDDQRILGMWFDSNTGGRTYPVGQLQANPFGLYDIHGNVWEWCQDRYASAAYAAFERQPAVDPQGPKNGPDRVFRGGSFFDGNQGQLRSAGRAGGPPQRVDGNQGFRIVLPVPTKPTPAPARKVAWTMGPEATALPGIVPRPAEFPGFGRWTTDLHRPNNGVTVCSVSPDAKLLALGDRSGLIRLYEIDTWKLKGWLPGHTEQVTSLDWSADGQWLASGSRTGGSPFKGTLRIWTPDGSSAAVHDVEGGIESLDWHPSEPLLLAGGYSQIVLCSLDGSPQRFRRSRGNGLAWCSDGEQFVVSEGRKEAQIWSRDGKRGPTLTGHTNDISQVATSPQGAIATLCMGEHAVRLWGPDASVRGIVDVDPSTRFISWNAQGDRLVVGEQNVGRIRILDEKGQEPYGGAIKASGPTTFCVFRNADILRLGGHVTELLSIVTSVTEGTTLERISRLDSCEGGSGTIAWHPEGSAFAVGGDVAIWHNAGLSLDTLPVKYITQLRWSPSGKLLSTISGGGPQSIHFFTPKGELQSALPAFSKHLNYHSLAWSPGGDRIAVSDSQEVMQWNTDRTRAPTLQSQDQKDRQRPVAWSPQGEIVSSGVEPFQIQFWDQSGKLGRTIPLETECTRLAFSPDGKGLAVGRKGAIEIRVATTGNLIATSEGPYSTDLYLSWSPNGEQLAVHQYLDEQVRILNRKLETACILNTRSRTLNDGFWNSTGQFAAGTNRDVRVWDGATGEPQWVGVQLNTPSGHLGHVAFSAAGEVLSSSGEVEKELIYLHEQPDGRIDILTPSQFRTRLAAWEAGGTR